MLIRPNWLSSQSTPFDARALGGGGAAAGAAAPDQAQTAGAGPNVAERLERLARLHAAGDLTDAEFQAAKHATLDGAAR